MFNHIINIVKRYIYVVKCKEGNLCMDGDLAHIKSNYLTERTIVELHEKNWTIFQQKWEPISNLFH